MFQRLSNGLTLAKHSWCILKLDKVRIPTKPDGVSNREAGHRSDPKPDAIPI
jgi:hypothetical protein